MNRKLYFYSNTNTLRSYLAHGIIGCNAYLQDHVHERTLGNLSETGLFLTHLALNEKASRKGLEDDANLFPVVLSVSVLTDADFVMPAMMLGKDGELQSGDMREYDPQRHLGVFLIGELPFHMVHAFLFYTKEHKTAFYDPSRNLWFPEDMYGSVTKAFTAALDADMLVQKGKELDALFSDDTAYVNLIKTVEAREKSRAVALMCTRTAYSPLGENWLNVDSLVIKLFQLDVPALLSPMSKQVREQFVPLDSPEAEDLFAVLCPKANGQPTEPERLNRLIVQTAFAFLMQTPRGTKPAALKLIEQLRGLTQKNQQDQETVKKLPVILQQAEQYFQSAMGGSFSELIASIPTRLPSLRGLMVVLKSSDERRIDLFEVDLNNFGFKRQDRRYARVLYAALNGWNPYSGERKKDLWLNRLCEAYALAKAPHPQMISAAYSHAHYAGLLPKKAKPPKSNTSGYTVTMKPIVPPETLRMQLLKALEFDANRRLILEYLLQHLKPKKSLEELLQKEYRVQKNDILGPDRQDLPYIRSSSPAEEVTTLNVKRFEQEWLAEGAVFEARYKSKGDKNILTNLYLLLTGDDDE